MPNLNYQGGIRLLIVIKNADKDFDRRWISSALYIDRKHWSWYYDDWTLEVPALQGSCDTTRRNCEEVIKEVAKQIEELLRYHESYHIEWIDLNNVPINTWRPNDDN